MKLWGGRFREPSAAAFEAFSESFSFDRKLAWADVVGTRAHARGLARAGVLDADEAAAVTAACDQLAAELDLQPPAHAPGVEDVHTWVLQHIEAVAGPVTKKLQTGRSRNEQVALDLRLYLIQQRPALHAGLRGTLNALAGFASTHAEVAIPGYTHLQRAQPVSLGHHTLAYAEMLLRDASRLRDAYTRLEVSPLGSGALAGTTWAVDREAEARELGLRGVTQNSLDAVADRDFAIEIVFALGLLGLHLSRWAEDWILYASTEFGWLTLGDAYATGSSLMPQKKNPDALELIRGKSASQLANLMRLLTLLKSLPLAYNRDLQEDKEAVFDAVETAIACLEIAAGVITTTGVNSAKAAAAVADPALLATDLADLLVAGGIAFHDAHAIVGAVISAALEQQRDFRLFTREEWERFAPGFDPAPVAGLTVAAALDRRNLTGGTAVAQVRRQAAALAARAAAHLG